LGLFAAAAAAAATARPPADARLNNSVACEKRGGQSDA